MIESNQTEPAEYVAYYRVSTRKQGDSQLGLEAQRAYIDHFYQGKNIIDRFTDVRSGKDISGRPQLQAAMALCKLRKATLVVAKVDRLSRDTEQALWIYRELETRLESCDVPNLDKFTLTLFMAIADRERELGGIRTKAAMQVKVKRDGEWRIGSEAFYSGEASRLGSSEVRRIARLNTNSRQAMAQIRHLRSQGQDYASIASQLNADGFRAPRGGEYATVQVRRLWHRIEEMGSSQGQTDRSLAIEVK